MIVVVVESTSHCLHLPISGVSQPSGIGSIKSCAFLGPLILYAHVLCLLVAVERDGTNVRD
jgi:hypothetical protein